MHLHHATTRAPQPAYPPRHPPPMGYAARRSAVAPARVPPGATGPARAGAADPALVALVIGQLAHRGDGLAELREPAQLPGTPDDDVGGSDNTASSS